jgi:MtaA/CmuA family methyltransferase
MPNLKGRDILLKAVRNEVTPRPPWLPFVGVHGSALIGAEAGDYLKSRELLVRGLTAAVERYRPDGLPVAFDLQLEAEILGCELAWSREGPPSVRTHPLASGASLIDLPSFDPGAGRFPVVLGALDDVARAHGADVAFYGLVCGPFTLGLHLLGSRIFLHMFDNPEYVKAVIGFCAAVGVKAARAYLEHGADVIAVVDPMTSQISPEHFEEFVSPALHQIFDLVRQKGALSSLFVCGDASRNLEVMSRTACDNISIDENIALERIRDVTRTCNKSFGGNLKLTTVLLLGDEDDARLDAIRCIDVGGSCGFVLAPGCDLPRGVPPRNLEAVAAIAHDAYQREVAKRTIIAKTMATAEPDLPRDFGAEAHVRIDVVTLDSASCAPCQYMMEAVRHAASRTSRPVIVKEHRITTREGIAAMGRLGARAIPTICLDGEVAFASEIPDERTLLAAVERRISAKPQ